MRNLYSNGLEISIFLSLFTFGLVIASWFLFREYIFAIVIPYLLVHIVMWLTIMILTLREKKK